MVTAGFRVSSSAPPDEAARFMTDYKNLPKWDPGTLLVVASSATDPRAFRLVTTRWPDLPIAYTANIEGENVLQLRSTSEDGRATTEERIAVEARSGGGCVVTYELRLQLRGMRWWAWPYVWVVMQADARRAGAGCAAALRAMETPRKMRM